MEDGEFILNDAEVMDKVGELGEKGEGVSPLFSSTSPFFMALCYYNMKRGESL